MCFISIQVLSHLHPCPQKPVSPPSMYHLTSIQVQKFVYHRHIYRVSPTFSFHLNSPQTSRLISIQASRFTRHFHPGRTVTQSRILHLCHISRLCLTPMQVPKKASQLHPGPISQGHLHMKMYVSPPYRSFLTSHTQDYCITPSMHHLTSIHVPQFFNSCCISPPISSWCWHFTSIHFTSHIHPGQENCSST